jgi:5S rRNA maturation endonuclease (ribonuclease M5)
MLYNYNNYNPCIGYYFNGRWKLYNYKADNYRFISNTSHQDLQGFDQLDWVGDICVITKSMKDVMLYRRFEINAVAPHSEALSNWKDKIELLKKRFKKVIINFDNDRAGIEATNKVLKEFDLDHFYIPDEKDLSDYYKKFGFEKTKQLLEQLI